MTDNKSDSQSNLNKVRIALATGTGERIDQHFARSPYFAIYEINDNISTFIENRKNTNNSCFCNNENEHQIFESIVKLIADCHFVVALRIGHGAISFLVDRGIRAAQIDDSIENALATIISSGKLRHLLRR